MDSLATRWGVLPELNLRAALRMLGVLIDRLVVSGHPSTPGFNDPAYPIEGRRARTAGLPR